MRKGIDIGMLIFCSVAVIVLMNVSQLDNAYGGESYLVKDINPTGDSYPGGVGFNGLLYFSADDGVHGWELWRSEGTTAGTYMVKDINPTGSANPQELTNVDGVLFTDAC